MLIPQSNDTINREPLNAMLDVTICNGQFIAQDYMKLMFIAAEVHQSLQNQQLSTDYSSARQCPSHKIIISSYQSCTYPALT